MFFIPPGGCSAAAARLQLQRGRNAAPPKQSGPSDLESPHQGPGTGGHSETMLLLALATVTTEHSIVPTSHRCTATTCAFTPEMFKHAAALNTGTSAVYLYWSISQDNDEIAIGVDAHDTRGWVAVGISANGGMMGADIWRLSKDGAGNLMLDDMFVEG